MVLQAIQKGSIDSCREAHEDWLAKVQASLAAPAHVLQGPTASNLSSQYQSASTPYYEATQVGKRLALLKLESSWQ